jgi:hypothetical protein
MIFEKHSEYTLLSLINFLNSHPSLDTGKKSTIKNHALCVLVNDFLKIVGGFPYSNSLQGYRIGLELVKATSMLMIKYHNNKLKWRKFVFKSSLDASLDTYVLKGLTITIGLHMLMIFHDLVLRVLQ